MKKIGITFLTACLGGAVAIGAYKLVETKYNDKLSFGEKQEVYFTNNPSAAISSTGDLDFTQAAAAVTPGVYILKPRMGLPHQTVAGMTPFRICLKIFLETDVVHNVALRWDRVRGF